ncbi:hypothetical protein LEM8419_02086 [Neolewinella maritima]|uniref:Uncharacterized protein n=1 Tax=Neolewinella maritima TaxID=1383882 RepID=A0ABM9B241_9BACT|nr:hypothetical protein [Neolewinella maritima]CAH1001188.1 hypothetical protein LEM8419_02086 [Neolewinella maritima]
MTHRTNLPLVLLIAGLGISVLAQLIIHFTAVADFAGGALTGIGVGLLLVGLMLPGRQRRISGE